MGFASEFVGVADDVQNRIAPVNVITWRVIPALFGVLLVFIILIIWKPKFTGTYKYRSCSGDKNDPGRFCETKTANHSTWSGIIIIILFLVIPSTFASVGYSLGFAINNPRVASGVYATRRIFHK